MKIVLNAIIARINGGGATQIVHNYLCATLKDTNVDWYYIISEELADMIKGQVKFDPLHWLILPRQPQISTYFKAKKSIDTFLDSIKPDLIYSILAPSYFTFKYKEVMRCCNAWDVIDKDDEAFSFIDKKTRIKFGFKTWIVRKLMRRADYFITQTQVAKDGIIKVTSKDKNSVAVIPNVLPYFYQSKMVEYNHTTSIDILYVASPAPHKNIEIVPKVAHILKYEYGLKNFRFIITIPKNESSVSLRIRKIASTLSVIDEVVNVGSKTQEELVQLYQSSSLGFFPSVLETFSATLLEYMYFKLPVVASNKSFNTEVLGDSSIYFETTDARAAADAIFTIINDEKLRNELLLRSEQRIKNYMDYGQHYSSTINFFNQIVEQQNKIK